VPTKETQPRVVVQRLDDLVDQLRCADVDVVGHTTPAPHKQEELCVVGADELEYFADIDFFNTNNDNTVEILAGKSATGAEHTENIESAAAEEKNRLVREGGVVGRPAPGLKLQLDLQQHKSPSSLDSDEAALFLNTPEPDLFNTTMNTEEPLGTAEAEKFLNDLWLESNLDPVDSWDEDNLFPDLI